MRSHYIKYGCYPLYSSGYHPNDHHSRPCPQPVGHDDWRKLQLLSIVCMDVFFQDSVWHAVCLAHLVAALLRCTMKLSGSDDIHAGSIPLQWMQIAGRFALLGWAARLRWMRSCLLQILLFVWPLSSIPVPPIPIHNWKSSPYIAGNRWPLSFDCEIWKG